MSKYDHVFSKGDFIVVPDVPAPELVPYCENSNLTNTYGKSPAHEVGEKVKILSCGFDSMIGEKTYLTKSNSGRHWHYREVDLLKSNKNTFQPKLL